jgi:hypothetical protein
VRERIFPVSESPDAIDHIASATRTARPVPENALKKGFMPEELTRSASRRRSSHWFRQSPRILQYASRISSSLFEFCSDFKPQIQPLSLNAFRTKQAPLQPMNALLIRSAVKFIWWFPECPRQRRSRVF